MSTSPQYSLDLNCLPYQDKKNTAKIPMAVKYCSRVAPKHSGRLHSQYYLIEIGKMPISSPFLGGD
jgi:hypothetical protein